MYEYTNGIPQGWQCPVCKRVYAPDMPYCTLCGNNVLEASNQTVGTIPEEFIRRFMVHGGAKEENQSAEGR